MIMRRERDQDEAIRGRDLAYSQWQELGKTIGVLEKEIVALRQQRSVMCLVFPVLHARVRACGVPSAGIQAAHRRVAETVRGVWTLHGDW